jgi:hypothetical protein
VGVDRDHTSVGACSGRWVLYFDGSPDKEPQNPASSWKDRGGAISKSRILVSSLYPAFRIAFSPTPPGEQAEPGPGVYRKPEKRWRFGLWMSHREIQVSDVYEMNLAKSICGKQGFARSKRRVPAYWNLHLGRKIPDRKCPARIERTNESRFGKIQLSSNVQYCFIAQWRIDDTNTRRIPLKRSVRKRWGFSAIRVLVTTQWS